VDVAPILGEAAASAFAAASSAISSASFTPIESAEKSFDVLKTLEITGLAADADA